MKHTIDRIEQGLAVLEREDGTMCHVPLAELPQGSAAGCALEKTPEGWIFADNSADKARIDEKFSRLLKRKG